MSAARRRVGVVGARGYVGQELVPLLLRHPSLEVAFVSSRTQAGKPVAGVVPSAPASLLFEEVSPAEVLERGVDALILALANGESAPWVEAADAAEAAGRDVVVVDVSADHRFDDAWAYGLPELGRARLRGARRIANPGCYATAMALVLAPVRDLLAGPAACFGVSGYSGAGATPSPRNDPEKLRDNVMAYQLTGHVHEREVSRHAAPCTFVPHVASFFRGIHMTVTLPLAAPASAAELRARYEAAYAGEPLVKLSDEAPLVREAVGSAGAQLGGFAVAHGPERAVMVSTLDNLLKGAASQAVQNLNLGLGLPELAGVLA